MVDTGSQFLLSGLLIACALFAGRAASSLGIPRVAAYLVIGIVFSPGLLGTKLGFQVGAWAESFTAGALGVIAYLIGGSMTTRQLHRLGKIIAGGTIGQSLGAMLLVCVATWALLSLHLETAALQLALAFGVLAISTAPAATLAVIHQYRTRGPTTDTLLGVVAVDDAVGIICFSLLLAFAANSTLSSGLTSAATAIGGAVLCGAIAGWILSRTSALFGESAARLPLLLSAILLVLGIAHRFELSALLTAMSLGFFARRFTRASASRLFKPIQRLEEIIFLLFFALAGTHFDPGLFLQHLDLILTYVCARFVGKIIGSAIGTKMARAPGALVRWLGFGLVPQAGIAVGLALTLSNQPAFTETGELIVNVILGATLVNELIGPMAAQFALRQAGETGIKRERHRHEGF